MLESKVEKHLTKEVEKLKGLCKKFVSPGWAGAPDRIVILPKGILYFIEVKAPGEKLRKLQAHRRNQIEALGSKAIRIDSIEAVNKFIEEVKSEIYYRGRG